MYQLSILLPSAYAEKREKFIRNLQATMADFNNTEIVICLDANNDHPHGTVERFSSFKHNNFVYCYENASPYRSRFFNSAWKASTGRFLLMANDDIEFKTKNWDKLIPYDKYPDDLVVFGLRDNQFDERFFCHPIWSRRAMELEEGLFEHDYWITKCDNVIWDIHPPHRRGRCP